MAGSRELGFPKINARSLKEQAARTTLRNVRSKGHPYVELREEGKRFIFFCTLCLAPCYSDYVLFDHLKGSLHTERHAAAKVTLLGSNPWPFNDGVVFFHDASEQDKQLSLLSSSQDGHLDSGTNENDVAVVCHGKSSDVIKGDGYSRCVFSNSDRALSSHDMNFNGDGEISNMIIPGVGRNDEISDLEVRFIGLGQIAARVFEDGHASKMISRLWCAWLGNEDTVEGGRFMVPEHDFAVVIFPYGYDLGRIGVWDDIRSLLSSSPRAEIENVKGISRKRKRSFSDPEDISESFSEQYGSSGEDSQASNSPTPRLLLDQYDDRLQQTMLISSKTVRRELRRQQRIAAERMCDVCQHKMLPGKDVAALLNTRTGRVACSSRNVNGAFHVFHTSCLIHWILICEYELRKHQLSSPKAKHVPGRKNGTKCREVQNYCEKRASIGRIYSVFCPECQGTGINTEGDELEKPTVALSEMFRYKMKATDARKAWMKSPEILPHCSTGFHFPSQLEEPFQEEVLPLKLLRFYRAD